MISKVSEPVHTLNTCMQQGTCLEGLEASPVSAILWLVIRRGWRLQGVRRGQWRVEHDLLWLSIQPVGLQAIRQDQAWNSLVLHRHIPEMLVANAHLSAFTHLASALLFLQRPQQASHQTMTSCSAHDALGMCRSDLSRAR